MSISIHHFPFAADISSPTQSRPIEIRDSGESTGLTIRREDWESFVKLVNDVDCVLSAIDQRTARQDSKEPAT